MDTTQNTHGMAGKRLFMVKRSVDIICAMIGLAVLTPLLLVVATAILVDTGRPVFFLQERIGLHGRTFRIIKFRTMVQGADVVSFGKIVGEDSQLITRTGGFLRRWSLDELPELINVLKGDMSLVGPRPTIPEQVANYDDYQRRRLAVRPGITGWAQVNGRVSLDWPQRIRLDVWYVEHWSPWLDLRILARTVGVVTRHVDVYPDALPQDRITDEDGTPSPPLDQT